MSLPLCQITLATGTSADQRRLQIQDGNSGTTAPFRCDSLTWLETNVLEWAELTGTSGKDMFLLSERKKHPILNVTTRVPCRHERQEQRCYLISLASDLNAAPLFSNFFSWAITELTNQNAADGKHFYWSPIGDVWLALGMLIRSSWPYAMQRDPLRPPDSIWVEDLFITAQ